MSGRSLLISFGAIGIPHRPFFWPPRFPPPPPRFPPPPPLPPPPPCLALPPPPPLPRAPAGFGFPLTLACPRWLDASVFLPGSYPPNALLRPPALPVSFAKPLAGSAV